MAKRALGPACLLIVRAVRSALDMAPDAKGALVACSGGPDSLALALCAPIATPNCGGALIVDHGLQAGATQAARRTAETLTQRGVHARVVQVEVGKGGGPEAAARSARYAALEAAARAGEVVLLGHTLDDQAETVLLGLARGSGTRSLSGMPVRRGRFVRPLLGLRRAVTEAACTELGVTPWRDPHNAEPRFARARVRASVLPTLEAELGPGIAQALARTAQLARADADLLDELAASHDLGIEPSCAELAALPTALRGRVLLRWLRSLGATDLGADHVHAVERLVTDWHGQAGAEVPGFGIRRSGGRLVAWTKSDHAAEPTAGLR